MVKTSVVDLRDAIIRLCRDAGVSIPRGARTQKINIAPVYANSRYDEALEELRAIAAAKGGRCLADEYAGGRSKLKFVCDAGHEWLASPNLIRSGTWCQTCALKAIADRKRLTIDMMREIARERGGECLSATYIDSTKKLLWRCGKCAHEWEASAGAIRRGSWCWPCGNKSRWEQRRELFGPSAGVKGTLKYTITDMRRLARERGGRCLSLRFMGTRVPHEWQCGACGRVWMAAPSDVKKGTWCAVCSRRRRWERHLAARRRPTKR
jgi:hypothetical protein